MVREIYENDERIATIMEGRFDPETGEILSDYDAAKLIDEIEEDNRDRIVGVAIYGKNNAALLEALKEERKKLSARIKRVESNVEFAKNFIMDRQNGKPIKDDARVSVSFRKSTKTIIDDLSKVPEQFIKPHTLTDDDVMKTEIKKAIQGGEEVAGAHLEEGQSCIIK